MAEVSAAARSGVADLAVLDAADPDVDRPLLAELRESRGLAPDPMRAFLDSGYLERIRAERVGGNAAGWGA